MEILKANILMKRATFSIIPSGSNADFTSTFSPSFSLPMRYSSKWTKAKLFEQLSLAHFMYALNEIGIQFEWNVVGAFYYCTMTMNMTASKYEMSFDASCLLFKSFSNIKSPLTLVAHIHIIIIISESHYVQFLQKKNTSNY